MLFRAKQGREYRLGTRSRGALPPLERQRFAGGPQAARAAPFLQEDQSAAASLAPAGPLRITSQSM